MGAQGFSETTVPAMQMVEKSNTNALRKNRRSKSPRKTPGRLAVNKAMEYKDAYFARTSSKGRRGRLSNNWSVPRCRSLRKHE